MTKKTVCYIDDSDSNLLLMRKVLADSYNFVELNTPEDAVIKLLGMKPDLILLDVNMPNIDGYQVCREIRLEADLNSVPVVFLTCRSTIEDRLEGFDAGGDAYFSKPFEISEIAKLVETLIIRYSNYQDALKQSEDANQMTYMVMKNSSESGSVIHYARTLSKTRDEQSLLNSTFNTLNEFNLTSTVLLKIDKGDIVARSDGQPFTLLESELLSMANKGERIISLGNKYLFCGNKCIFLIKNMPIDDSDFTGRLRDHLAIMLESCDACIELINYTISENKTRQQSSSNTEKAVMEEFGKITQLFESLNGKVKLTFDNLSSKIEDSYLFMGLTDEQESKINEILGHSAEEVEQYLDSEVIIKQSMNKVSHLILELGEKGKQGGLH